MKNEDLMLQGKDPRFAKMFAEKGIKTDLNVDLFSDKKAGVNSALVEVETMLDKTKVNNSFFVIFIEVPHESKPQ